MTFVPVKDAPAGGGGLFAARVGDMHNCPMFDGPKAHVGGPINPPGMENVLIEGMPAARETDQCTCIGPPDAIASGSPTVFIGGLKAARVTDPTVHGGIIAKGAAKTYIGNGKGGGDKAACHQAASAKGSAVIS